MLAEVLLNDCLSREIMLLLLIGGYMLGAEALMQTKTPDIKLFTLSGAADRLSCQTLEDIAREIADRPEFPSRLTGAASDAFARVCFELLLRHGQGQYDGYRQQPSMRRIGAFFLSTFNTDPRLETEVAALMHLDDDVSAEVVELLPEARYKELPDEAAGSAEPKRVDVTEATEVPFALIEARKRVESAYNDLP